MKTKNTLPLIFILTVLTLILSCKPKKAEQTKFVLGTFCTIKTEAHKNAEKTVEQAFERLFELDRIFNANTTNSELISINEKAYIAPIKVSTEITTVLEMAIEFAEKTDSAFEPALGKIIKLWNIGFDNANIPKDEDIKKYLPYATYKNIELKNDTLFLKSEFTKLDLGGIVKGFAADEVAKILKEAGINNAVINFGGNVFALGKKSKTDKWRIGLRSPIGSPTDIALVLELENKTVVTSGTYERFFERDGIKYHHILNAKTGYPVRNNLLSVTIIADNSMLADTLSTACITLGYEKSLALLKEIPTVEAIFFFDDGTYVATDDSFISEE